MVNLSISGDSIVFEFINSNYYLQNGKIATPINSLALITDESNIATFKKASSNDIFVAATYDELGKTKAELIEWFKDNAVGATGGGDLDDYYTKEQTDALLSGKTDLSTFTAYSASVDTALSGKASQSDLNTLSGDITNVQTALNGKANASDLQALEVVVGTKANATDLDSLANVVNGKVDLTAYTAYTSSTETTINGKADTSDLQALETIVGGKADATAVTAEISAAVSGKADTTAMTTALADKLDISTFETYSGSVDTALSGKASQTDLNAVSGAVDTKLNISDFNTYSGNVNTALSNKADTSDLANYVEVTAYTAYTSATDTALSGKASQTDLNALSGSVANKQDLLVSGTNIKTVNGNSLLGSGNITIEVDVDSALDSGSTNAVANSAITKAIQDNELVVANALITLQDDVDTKASQTDLNAVSAATASNTAALGGFSIVKMTSAEYEALTVKEQNTIYFIVD